MHLNFCTSVRERECNKNISSKSHEFQTKAEILKRIQILQERRKEKFFLEAQERSFIEHTIFEKKRLFLYYSNFKLYQIFLLSIEATFKPRFSEEGGILVQRMVKSICQGSLPPKDWGGTAVRKQVCVVTSSKTHAVRVASRMSSEETASSTSFLFPDTVQLRFALKKSPLASLLNRNRSKLQH